MSEGKYEVTVTATPEDLALTPEQRWERYFANKLAEREAAAERFVKWFDELVERSGSLREGQIRD